MKDPERHSDLTPDLRNIAAGSRQPRACNCLEVQLQANYRERDVFIIQPLATRLRLGPAVQIKHHRLGTNVPSAWQLRAKQDSWPYRAGTMTLITLSTLVR